MAKDNISDKIFKTFQIIMTTIEYGQFYGNILCVKSIENKF